MNNQHFKEIFRPWKFATFAVALAIMIAGGLFLRIPDWDVGISILMGTLTYLFAPWSYRTVARMSRERPRGWVLKICAAIVVTVLVVDGSYWVYNTLVGHPMFRHENFVISLTLYIAAGWLWSRDVSLRELLGRLRKETLG